MFELVGPSCSQDYFSFGDLRQSFATKIVVSYVQDDVWKTVFVFLRLGELLLRITCNFVSYVYITSDMPYGINCISMYVYVML